VVFTCDAMRTKHYKICNLQKCFTLYLIKGQWIKVELVLTLIINKLDINVCAVNDTTRKFGVEYEEI
jgi:hypothetical protein